MKERIRQKLHTLINQIVWEIDLPIEKIVLKQNTSNIHGDFSTNIALQLAKPLSQSPQSIAQQLIPLLADSFQEIEKIEIAGAGFINIFLQKSSHYEVVEKILSKQGDYAQGETKQQRVLVEFVSANPTGPLHVGHGRGAVYGDSLARLLSKAGFQVESEYYINDAGRQMEILTLSTLLRYTQKHTQISAEKFAQLYPANAYQGEYLIQIANEFSAKLTNSQKEILEQIDYTPFMLEENAENQENHIDKLIAFVKKELDNKDASLYPLCKKFTLNAILTDIREDLQEMGVNFNVWFSEQSLVDDGSVDDVLQTLEHKKQSYHKDGAIWFKSSELGDDKDRVLVRQDGVNTYLAHDICYHKNKFERGYNRIINVWGADHHGYIARMQAAINALGYDEKKMAICLVQFANLYRGEEKISMSTRSGDFVSLRELREEVGNDATRFFYNLNRADQHLNFDLQLAIEKTNDNPVFYVQYAYARIQSIFRRLQERNYRWEQQQADLSLLNEELELNLIRTLTIYPQKIQDAASKNAPHIITLYLRELSAQVHQYYNQSTILVEQKPLRNARLNLLFALSIVLQDALNILGVNAPSKM
jgi:arginyl-tRNA synthetase